MRRSIIAVVSAALIILVPAVAEANKLTDGGPAAIKRFQRAHGLVVDGIYGRQTAACYRHHRCRGVAPGPLHSRSRAVRSRRGGSSSYASSNPYVNPYCESSGNPQVWDPSHTYWGKYQFDRRTWIAHGGSPSSYGHASEAEQDRVAARVKYDAWPNC